MYPFKIEKGTRPAYGRNGCPSGLSTRRRSGGDSTLDLGGRDRYAIALLQDLVPGYRLAVNADQVILVLLPGHAFAEESFDGRAVGDLDKIGEASAVVVHIENLHGCFLS